MKRKQVSMRKSVKASPRHPGSTSARRTRATRALHGAPSGKNGLAKPSSGEGPSVQLLSLEETERPSAAQQQQEEEEDDDAGNGDQDVDKCPDSLLEDGSMLLDEDSNQIMPVGCIFGNLDLIQDYPVRNPVKAAINRREYRKLHFIAKEDSDDDDEDGPLGSAQQEGVQQCTKNRKNGLF